MAFTKDSIYGFNCISKGYYPRKRLQPELLTDKLRWLFLPSVLFQKRMKVSHKFVYRVVKNLVIDDQSGKVISLHFYFILSLISNLPVTKI